MLVRVYAALERPPVEAALIPVARTCTAQRLLLAG